MIEKFLKTGCDAFENKSMSLYTTFKIGGNADFLLVPHSVSELKFAIQICKQHGIRFIIIGNGSNLLVSDNGIKGAVIHLGNKFSQIRLKEDKIICADAGVSLSKLAMFAMENSLSGLEFCYGIPGNVGGGLYMNAGAYGGELKNSVIKIHHLDHDLNECSFTAQQADMNYRHTLYHENSYVIIGGEFALKVANKDDIKATMTEIMNKRSQKQPLDYPSAGSTFKRPNGAFAAELIEKCNLKGYSIGGAMVSKKHSGFVINYNNATCNEVLELSEFVKNTVYQRTGHKLELEVRIVD